MPKQLDSLEGHPKVVYEYNLLFSISLLHVLESLSLPSKFLLGKMFVVKIFPSYSLMQKMLNFAPCKYFLLCGTWDPPSNSATLSHVAINSVVGVKLPEDGNNSCS